MYYVRGGIYDSDFTTILMPEEYEPFKTRDQALVEWRRRTFTQLLDNCFHKLHLEEDIPPIVGAEILRRFTRPDND